MAHPEQALKSKVSGPKGSAREDVWSHFPDSFYRLGSRIWYPCPRGVGWRGHGWLYSLGAGGWALSTGTDHTSTRLAKTALSIPVLWPYGQLA